VQVEPIKPTLKAPGTERLKLRCNVLLSNFPLNFKLRRYNWDDLELFFEPHAAASMAFGHMGGEGMGAGAYTRPLFGST
jgi:hypothetical protein